MNFGPYFEPWFRFAYFACLVPFRIVNNEKSYSILTNSLQMVICGIFHITSSVACLAEIQGVIVSNVFRDQALLIKLIERVNSTTSAFIFIYLVWWKQEKVIAIFGSPEQKKNSNSRNVEIWSRISIIIIFVLSVGTFFSWLIFYGEENLDFEKIMNKRTRKFFYEFLGKKADDNVESKWKVATIVALIPRFYKWILIDLVTYLVGITSWVVLIQTKKFKALLMTSTPSSDFDELEVLDYYVELKRAVQKFNELLGPTYIKIFITLITFCAVNVYEILNAKSPYFPLVLGFYFGLNITPFICAAEAHCVTVDYKKWLLSRPRRSISAMFDYLNIANSHLALRGCYFFTITYSFLGTTCSVALTYAILMIQSAQSGSGTPK